MHLIPSRIILKVDGGICSQMHFYMIGRLLESNHNCKVNYDITWFETTAKDTDGRFSRNFDLLKMFPDIPFKAENSGFIRKIYISCFYRLNRYCEHSPSELFSKTTSPPLFLDGYFSDPPQLYSIWFDRLFKVNTDVLPEDNLKVLSQIKNANTVGETCAVHIRRGDLSHEHPIYGKPCQTSYFIDAFNKISNIGVPMTFFVFSDEPNWFKENIKSYLTYHDIKIIDLNGSDRGWCDLILMSLCRHQITSHGSMGKYAAMLRDTSDKNGIVILPDNKISYEWKDRFPNSIIIS